MSASADALIRTAEERIARALGPSGRRNAGVYYTPPEVAARVVEIALAHGSVRRGRVLDPCAGAGSFLVAAARAGFSRVCGIDLDPRALRVARKALRLCGVSRPSLRRADSLRFTPAPADLLVSNPPYGHVEDPRERSFLARALPALRGGEIDRYAAFLLRSLQLVRPGGTVALLVPDTWMFLARAGALREAVMAQAEVAALVDLGKVFASAKDTRVQAVVLVRRLRGEVNAVHMPDGEVNAVHIPDGEVNAVHPVHVARGREVLAPASREELLRSAQRGWFVYRTRGERALCEAMEAASVPLHTVCDVGYGMRTGDNARHVARRAPRPGEVGLLGGEDVTPFALRWRPKTLLDGAPLQALVDRQRGRGRVCVQRIRTNSAAPWARWLEAAPVPPELDCLDSLSTQACEDEDRLWALLALVSSVAMNRYHRLRTTDVNVKPSALRQLPAPRDLLRAPQTLAGLARRRAISAQIDLDRRIDAAIYALYGLRPELVEACERGFWGNRFGEEFQKLEQAMSDPPGIVARKEKNA